MQQWHTEYPVIDTETMMKVGTLKVAGSIEDTSGGYEVFEFKPGSTTTLEVARLPGGDKICLLAFGYRLDEVRASRQFRPCTPCPLALL